MMADLGCQLHNIWNQLKTKQLDTFVRVSSLNYLRWEDLPSLDHLRLDSHLKSGLHILVATHVKEQVRS